MGSPDRLDRVGAPPTTGELGRRTFLDWQGPMIEHVFARARADELAFIEERAAAERPFLERQTPWARADLVICGTPEIVPPEDRVMIALPGTPNRSTPDDDTSKKAPRRAGR